MLHAFVYNEIAILVRHWFEVSLEDSHLEHGARIELRLRSPQPHRGTESAAQRVVADQPLWRADLFDRIDGVRGGFEAAHFHPRFDGVEPCERHWADKVKAAPWDWLHDQLSDIAGVAGGRNTTARPWRGQRAGPGRRAGDRRCRAEPRRDPLRGQRAVLCVDPGRGDLVHLMLDRLAKPELLDRDRVSPWLARQKAR